MALTNFHHLQAIPKELILMFFNQIKLSHHFCKPNNIHILTYWVVLSQIITPPPQYNQSNVYNYMSLKASKNHEINFTESNFPSYF